MLAKEIMTKEVITVGPDTPVPEIARILAANNISGVPVVDDNGKVIGIVSEADLLIKHEKTKVPYRLALFGLWVVPDEAIAEAYKSARRDTTAADVMTRNVITFNEEDEVDKIAEVMVRKKINRVPILSDGKLVGIVSRGDILRAIVGV